MAEQLKQNDSKIAYIVSSGNYHRKVYQNGSSYVLKSLSKTGIKVNITALTTTTSSKSTYSGTVGIYNVTSSSSRNYMNSNRTLLNSYTTTSSSSNNLFYDSLISSSSRTSRYTSSSRSYYTYLRTDFLIKSLIASSVETQYKKTSLSEYNNQSYTTFTTNRRYTGTVPSYNASNTYPYISFTTTGNIWNVTLNGYVNITTTSVPDYGTLSSKQKVYFFDDIDEVVHIYTMGKSYTSMLSSTTTFTSYVSSITY